MLFTRLAATVRACIALESRLAAGATTTRTIAATLLADPRRDLLHRAFEHLTKHRPDRAKILRETNLRIDAELTADPDRTMTAAGILFAMCEEIGLEINFATMPDEYIGMAPHEAPHPRATSPP